MKTYKVTVEYEFETNADSEREALINVTDDIYNSLSHNLRDVAKVGVKKLRVAFRLTPTRKNDQ